MWLWRRQWNLSLEAAQQRRFKISCSEKVRKTHVKAPVLKSFVKIVDLN